TVELEPAVEFGKRKSYRDCRRVCTEAKRSDRREVGCDRLCVCREWPDQQCRCLCFELSIQEAVAENAQGRSRRSGLGTGQSCPQCSDSKTRRGASFYGWCRCRSCRGTCCKRKCSRRNA